MIACVYNCHSLTYSFISPTQTLTDDSMERDACELHVLGSEEPGGHASTVDQCLHRRYSTHRRAGHLGTDNRGDSHNRGTGGHRAACHCAVTTHRAASRAHEPSAYGSSNRGVAKPTVNRRRNTYADKPEGNQ